MNMSANSLASLLRSEPFGIGTDEDLILDNRKPRLPRLRTDTDFTFRIAKLKIQLKGEYRDLSFRPRLIMAAVVEVGHAMVCRRDNSRYDVCERPRVAVVTTVQIRRVTRL
ncbi:MULTISPECIES: hypothetical protein [unclassified Bradyrhizobium]|uniref:hypothetical protein n=1 Tax=unclassified Bradyrhizobium TaxID=2631580 RepID=UPI0028E4EFC4|nr:MULTISPECIES: hypothetical protein [unclassified Bradyrhizobium]